MTTPFAPAAADAVPAIEVNGAPLDAAGRRTLAQIEGLIGTVQNGAALGGRTMTMTTGVEVALLANGFTVIAGTPSLASVTPSTGQQGQTLARVEIVGQNTSWTCSATLGHQRGDECCGYCTLAGLLHRTAHRHDATVSKFPGLLPPTKARLAWLFELNCRDTWQLGKDRTSTSSPPNTSYPLFPLPIRRA